MKTSLTYRDFEKAGSDCQCGRSYKKTAQQAVVAAIVDRGLEITTDVTDVGYSKSRSTAVPKLSCRSGMTLIGVIAAIVILGLLGAGVLMLMAVGAQESLQALNRGQAFFAAESGVSKARASTNATNVGVVGQASFVAIVDANGGITSVGSKDEAQWTSIWRPEETFPGAMLVYGTSTNAGTPQYRIWGGTNWSDPSNAVSVGAVYLNWVVVKACPTRDEYIAATIDTNRVVKAQVYRNGSWGNLQTITNVLNAAYRGVDVAYESLSGDALVVAAPNKASNFTYCVWNGTAWTAPTNKTVSRAGVINWVSLASDPVSDELIVMVQNTNRYYTARVWNGSNAWGNELLCTGRTVAVAYEAMDVAYETSGDQAVIVNNSGIASTTLGIFNWCSWNGTNWSAQTTNQPLHQDYFRFARLVNDPNSDKLLLTYVDNDSDIGRLFWNGSAWTTYKEMTASGNSATDRPVEGQFETISTNAGHALIPYSDTTYGYSMHAADPSGSTWDTAVRVSTITDSSTVQSRRTGDGKILALFFDDANTRYDFSWHNGTNWSAMETLENEPSVLASPWKEPFMMAPQRFIQP